MEVEKDLIPESEEEMEMVDDLAVTRKRALDRLDIDREDVATAFIEFGLAIDRGVSQEGESGHSCPECGNTILDHEAEGVGADPVLKPCGHEVSWAEMPEEYVRGSVLKD